MQKNNWTFWNSVQCALHGIRDAIAQERNMRIHISIGILVVYCAYHVNFSSVEWCLLFLVIGGVFAGELFNTAVEHAVDAKTNEYQMFARKAKDAAAGGELVMAILAIAVGLLLFLQKERIQNLAALWTRDWFRIVALVVYLVLAGWFIISGKKHGKRRIRD